MGAEFGHQKTMGAEFEQEKTLCALQVRQDIDCRV